MLLELAGVRTHVVVDPPTGPTSGPPVVLCSGLAGNWFDWDACTELLRDRTVVRLDRPGYGRSEPWPDGAVPTLGSEVTRLRELLDALEIPRAVVCGHSMASFYVEAFARRDPDRVAAMVLLDGSVETSPRWTLPARMRDGLLLRTADLAAAARIHRTVVPVAHRLLAGAPAPRRFAPILTSEAYLRATLLENGRYPVLAKELAALRELAPLPARLPATVAAAYSGRPTPWAASWLRRQRELADLLRARYAVIAPSGHQAMVDQPTQTAALILDADSGVGAS